MISAIGRVVDQERHYCHHGWPNSEPIVSSIDPVVHSAVVIVITRRRLFNVFTNFSLPVCFYRKVDLEEVIMIVIYSKSRGCLLYESVIINNSNDHRIHWTESVANYCQFVICSLWSNDESMFYSFV